MTERQGTYKGWEGNRIVFETERGPWPMFATDAVQQFVQSNIQPGSPVAFEATMPQGKSYWRCTKVRTQQGPQPAAAAAPQPQQPRPQRPAPQRQPARQDDNVPTVEEQFVKAVVGGAMSSGQFGITDIDLLSKSATQAWRDRGANSRPEPGAYNVRQGHPPEPPPPTSEEEYQ